MRCRALTSLSTSLFKIISDEPAMCVLNARQARLDGKAKIRSAWALVNSVCQCDTCGVTGMVPAWHGAMRHGVTGMVS